jgi:Tol biopolymer transport system component
MMQTSKRARRALGPAVAGALLVAGTLAAHAAGLSFTQLTSTNLGYDTAPAWSRDGLDVYYSSRVQGLPYIFYKPADAAPGVVGTRLTSWTIEEFAATVSADDSWAMISARDSLGSTHLWRCPATGGAPLTQATFGPYNDLKPDWWGSGAAQAVAFCSDRGGPGFQICTLVPNGILPATQVRQVTDAGHQDFDPSWAPDGQAIAFSSDRAGTRQIFIVRRQGQGWGSPQQVTSGSGDKSNPAWSPNGNYLAYQQLNGSDTSLWLCTASGANPQMITGSGSYDAEPAFSPDGNSIVFVSNRTGGNYIWLALDVSTPARPDTWGRIKDRYRQ